MGSAGQRRSLRFWFALLSGALSCSSAVQIHTQVTSFHQLPSNLTGSTYSIEHSPEQEGSLEFRSYEERVAAHLERVGFPAAQLGLAEYVVTIVYAIDGGRELVSSYPVTGQTGISSSNTTGTVQRYGSAVAYSGTTTYSPSYGVIGTGVSSRTEYTRKVRIEIFRTDLVAREHVEKVYEAEGYSTGSTGQLSAIVPSMIEAIFLDFPAQNGSVRHVDLEAVPSVEQIRSDVRDARSSRAVNSANRCDWNRDGQLVCGEK
jgi:hypothetical protein